MLQLTITVMPTIFITPPEGERHECASIPENSDSPGELFRRILDGEPNVYDVLEMLHYKLFLKLKDPKEFMRLGDPVLIDLTWDVLVTRGWKLEILL